LKFAVGIAVPCALLLVLWTRLYFWPVDMFRSAPVIICALKDSATNSYRLEQLFVGDGYATKFVHTDFLGREWIFGIDADARKAWSGHLALTNGKVEVSILKHRFYYDPGYHTAKGAAGGARPVWQVSADRRGADVLVGGGTNPAGADRGVKSQ